MSSDFGFYELVDYVWGEKYGGYRIANHLFVIPRAQSGVPILQPAGVLLFRQIESVKRLLMVPFIQSANVDLTNPLVPETVYRPREPLKCTDRFAREAISELMGAVCIRAWLTFEAVAGELWRLAVNKRPHILGHRIAKGGGQDGKKIDFNTLAKHRFNIQDNVGDVLATKFQALTAWKKPTYVPLERMTRSLRR